MGVVERPVEDPSDEELLARFRAGDEAALNALLDRFRTLVRRIARTFYTAWGAREDLVQEGMIGLLEAFRSHRADGGASLRTFAHLCVTRAVISAVKASTRQKHRALNSAVSLHAPIADGSDERLMDRLPAPSAADPEEHLIEHEELRSVTDALDGLTEREARVLEGYLSGDPPRAIAARSGLTAKQVDNALSRVKDKLRRNVARTLAAVSPPST